MVELAEITGMAERVESFKMGYKSWNAMTHMVKITLRLTLQTGWKYGNDQNYLTEMSKILYMAELLKCEIISVV